MSATLTGCMSSRLLDQLIDRIRRLREARGLTQEAFAEEASISYKYYQAIEGGRKRDLRLSTLERLARAHGIATWELLMPGAAGGELHEPAQAAYRVRRGKKKRAAARKNAR